MHFPSPRLYHFYHLSFVIAGARVSLAMAPSSCSEVVEEGAEVVPAGGSAAVAGATSGLGLPTEGEEGEPNVAALREMLAKERRRAQALAEENKRLKEASMANHAASEQEEERVMNKLMVRLDGIAREKAEIVRKVEEEEEYLTNTLQAKLLRVQNEKSAIEQSLEQEQEYIVNSLRRKVEQSRVEKERLVRDKEALKEQVRALTTERARLTLEKVKLEQHFEVEEEQIINSLGRQLEELARQKRFLERRLADSSASEASEDEHGGHWNRGRSARPLSRNGGGAAATSRSSSGTRSPVGPLHRGGTVGGGAAASSRSSSGARSPLV